MYYTEHNIQALFQSNNHLAAGSRSGSNLLGIRSYFRMVSEHKDIVRAVMALQGMMYMYKPDIEKLLTVSNYVLKNFSSKRKSVISR